jgi:hypothetical protein
MPLRRLQVREKADEADRSARRSARLHTHQRRKGRSLPAKRLREPCPARAHSSGRAPPNPDRPQVAPSPRAGSHARPVPLPAL